MTENVHQPFISYPEHRVGRLSQSINPKTIPEFLNVTTDNDFTIITEEVSIVNRQLTSWRYCFYRVWLIFFVLWTLAIAASNLQGRLSNLMETTNILEVASRIFVTLTAMGALYGVWQTIQAMNQKEILKIENAIFLFKLELASIPFIFINKMYFEDPLNVSTHQAIVSLLAMTGIAGMNLVGAYFIRNILKQRERFSIYSSDPLE